MERHRKKFKHDITSEAAITWYAEWWKNVKLLGDKPCSKIEFLKG